MKVAVLGSGNIGTDLMVKLLRRRPQVLEMAALVGVDPASEGLARAERLGVWTTHRGLQGLIDSPLWSDIRIVFDATSAKAHLAHAPILRAHGKLAIDLTPAAVGPYCVPVVNLHEHVTQLNPLSVSQAPPNPLSVSQAPPNPLSVSQAPPNPLSVSQAPPNVNLVTCGGQATIPIVAAVGRVAPVHYGEIVASIASKSAGPGTRQNIDEFTETTARAIEVVGGARRGKAIIVLNPAEPALIMRDTVFTLSEEADTGAIAASIERMVAEVQTYVPGYRLKQDVQFESLTGVRVPGLGVIDRGLKTSVFLEVEGAGHYLPVYAGNLDIMTSAALATGERLATYV